MLLLPLQGAGVLLLMLLLLQRLGMGVRTGCAACKTVQGRIPWAGKVPRREVDAKGVRVMHNPESRVVGNLASTTSSFPQSHQLHLQFK